MTWDDYYEKINDWAVSTAVNRISGLEDMGAPDEIVDALNIIAFEDEKGATRLLNRALQYGVKFSGDNLVEISGVCSEESFKKALYQSADILTAQDLEELYGCINDELIAEVAKKQNLRLPEDMRDEYEEEAEDVEYVKYEIQSAFDAADYALACLTQAQIAINNGSNVSFIDMLSKRTFTSVWKFSALAGADREVQVAQAALQSLNIELQNLSKNKSVQLKCGRLASVIDMWSNSGIMNWLVYIQINNAQKQIQKAIAQVEKIRRELAELYKQL